MMETCVISFHNHFKKHSKGEILCFHKKNAAKYAANYVYENWHQIQSTCAFISHILRANINRTIFFFFLC